MKIKSQVIKFGAVGVLNTLIDYGLFNLLVYLTGFHSGVKVGIINALTVTLAAANSYFLNRNWTFEAREGKHSSQLTRFVIATFIGVLINSAVVTAVSGVGKWLAVSPYIILNGGKLLGAVLSILWNFVSYRLWVFNQPPAANQDEAGAGDQANE
ncbi:MAG: GtrA family protein [Candidatus Saccharibacteria bacterium]